MKIREYLEKKYGRNTSLSLLACEASALGIHYPLQHGWLDKAGGDEITAAQRIRLIAALRKSKSEYAPGAIVVLEAPEPLSVQANLIHALKLANLFILTSPRTENRDEVAFAIAVALGRVL